MCSISSQNSFWLSVAQVEVILAIMAVFHLSIGGQRMRPNMDTENDTFKWTAAGTDDCNESPVFPALIRSVLLPACTYVARVLRRDRVIIGNTCTCHKRHSTGSNTWPIQKRLNSRPCFCMWTPTGFVDECGPWRVQALSWIQHVKIWADVQRFTLMGQLPYCFEATGHRVRVCSSSDTVHQYWNKDSTSSCFCFQDLNEEVNNRVVSEGCGLFQFYSSS